MGAASAKTKRTKKAKQAVTKEQAPTPSSDNKAKRVAEAVANVTKQADEGLPAKRAKTKPATGTQEDGVADDAISSKEKLVMER